MRKIIFKCFNLKVRKFNKVVGGGLLLFMIVIGSMYVFSPEIKDVLTQKVKVYSTKVSQNERKLPIYCVETSQKKVSISFDAAWGAYQNRLNYLVC